MLIQDQFGIIQKLQKSPIPQTNFFIGTFFAASYSKTAIEQVDKKGKQKVWMKPTCVTDNTVFILGHRSSKTDEN